MQHLFFHIVLFFLIFKTMVAGAVIPVLPDDFEGINTKNYIKQLENDEDYVPSMAQTGGIMFELGRYFDNKYPNDEIFSDDYEDELISELKRFFPDEDTKTLRERLALLRNSVKIYRAGKGFYNKYLEQKIVPHDYKKVHSAADYDHDGEFAYIEAADGEFYKIYNFKKFPMNVRQFAILSKLPTNKCRLLIKLIICIKKLNGKNFRDMEEHIKIRCFPIWV